VFTLALVGQGVQVHDGCPRDDPGKVLAHTLSIYRQARWKACFSGHACPAPAERPGCRR
jgi:hypothetical protein